MTIVSRPTELDIPVSWAEGGTATDPGPSLRDLGWDGTSIPTPVHLNWLLRTIYRVERWLDGHLTPRVTSLADMRDYSHGEYFDIFRNDSVSSIHPVSGTDVDDVSMDGDVILARVANSVRVYDAADHAYMGSVTGRHGGTIEHAVCGGFLDSVNGFDVFFVIEASGGTTYVQSYGWDLGGSVQFIMEGTISVSSPFLARPVFDQSSRRLFFAGGSTVGYITVDTDGTFGSSYTQALTGTIRALAVMVRGSDSLKNILLVAHDAGTSQLGTADTILEAVSTNDLTDPIESLDVVDTTYDQPAVNGLAIGVDGYVYLQKSKSTNGDGILQALAVTGVDGSGYQTFVSRATMDIGQNYPREVVYGVGGVAMCVDGANERSTMISAPWGSVVSRVPSDIGHNYMSGIVCATDGWIFAVRMGEYVVFTWSDRVHAIGRKTNQNFAARVCPWLPHLRYLVE